MAEPDRSPQEQTEVIPQVETGEGASSTLEIPAVPAAPAPPAPLNPKVNVPRPVGQEPTGPIYDQLYDRTPTGQQAAMPPGYGPEPGYGQPRYGQPEHGQPEYGQPGYGQTGTYQPGYGQTGGYPPAAAPPPAPAAGPSKANRQITLILSGAIVVLLVVIAGILLVHQSNAGGSDAKATTKPSAAAVAKLTPSISSFTENGSGFRQDGSSWVTQTYTTPAFGGLKKGAGLVLDLGSAATVSTVSFDAGTGPLQVELRSADSQPSTIAGWTKVSSNDSASGAVSLDGSKGGKHQYWMIWVTRLGSGDNAKIGDISVKGAP